MENQHCLASFKGLGKIKPAYQHLLILLEHILECPLVSSNLTVPHQVW